MHARSRSLLAPAATRKMSSKQSHRIRSFCVIAASLLLFCGTLLSADQPAFHPGKIHIVLVGDSTVTDNAGWGKGFSKAMKEDVEVINLSKGGRSSKSAIAEGMLKKAIELKPDYILIQFGHNDQPGHGADRETDP